MRLLRCALRSRREDFGHWVAFGARPSYGLPSPLSCNTVQLRAKKVTREQQRVIEQLNRERMPITRIAKTVGLSRPTVYDVLAAS